MNKFLRLSLFSFLFFLTVFLPFPSLKAITYFYDFSSKNGNLGLSETYTSNSVAITALGYQTLAGKMPKATELWGNNSGDPGLGLKNQSSHEIDPNYFVQLDLQNLWATNPNPSTIKMTIGDVDPGNYWKIFGSNTQGTLGTLIQQGSIDAPNSFMLLAAAQGYRYLAITSGQGEIILTSLAASSVPVPEPTTLLLLGTGSVLAILRKKRMSKL